VWAMEKESSYLPQKMAGFRMIKVCLDRHLGMLGVRVVLPCCCDRHSGMLGVRVVADVLLVGGCWVSVLFAFAEEDGRLSDDQGLP
jgi:hypothetical protein